MSSASPFSHRGHSNNLKDNIALGTFQRRSTEKSATAVTLLFTFDKLYGDGRCRTLFFALLSGPPRRRRACTGTPEAFEGVQGLSDLPLAQRGSTSSKRRPQRRLWCHLETPRRNCDPRKVQIIASRHGRLHLLSESFAAPFEWLLGRFRGTSIPVTSRWRFKSVPCLK